MKLSVFGLGYVGSVTAACLAALGHDVIGVDIDRGKISAIREGRSPVAESGLDDLINTVVKSGRLRVTSSVAEAVGQSELSLVCVGTPSRQNGSLDTSFVEKVVEEIATSVEPGSEHVIVVRSTVLPGTSADRLLPIVAKAEAQEPGRRIRFAVNPEFMREGTAIEDFHNSSFTIIGAADDETAMAVEQIYQGTSAPVVKAEVAVAEMVKYASNVFHAMKVGFANEIGALAHAHGVDGRDVMDIFLQDTALNVSGAYLRPGFAFGGSCLPKDTRALAYRAREADVSTPLLDAVMESNESHVRRAIRSVESHGRRKVLMIGLSFKSGTDDLRESPFVSVAEALIGRGYEIAVYDPDVAVDRLIGMNREYILRELPHIASILIDDLAAAIDGAGIIVVGKSVPDLHRELQNTRTDQVVLDLVGRVDADIPARCDALCW